MTVGERDRRVRLVRPTRPARSSSGVIESALDGIERRWAPEVGPRRWATFCEVLRQIGS